MPPRSWSSIAILACSTLFAACNDTKSAAPLIPTAAADRHDDGGDPMAAALVRQLAAARGVVPLPAAPRVRPELVRLGQALLFDPILSGNRNISCSTCHLPAFATGDGRSLSVGEGADGLGPARVHPLGTLIARNAPPLFNLGAMRHLFWDGRVQQEGPGGVDTPAGAQLTPAMQRVFEFGPASAIAMFPVTNRAEMRGSIGNGSGNGNGGDAGVNELAAIPDDDMPAIWSKLMARLGAIPEYRAFFEAAYPGTRFDDMTFAHASNAIGGFMVDKLSFANTPWDQFLAGDDRALTTRQLEGARTFLTLKCSLCHNGSTLSDEQFHNVAVAQIGPGEGDGASKRDDFGRMRVTGLADDRYRFRTSPLRNVELTGPYGHDGSIASLRGFIEHYSESDLKLTGFDAMTLDPSLRGSLLGNSSDVLLQRDAIIAGVVLTPELVDKLVDYMQALTDNASRDLTRLVPVRVPSQLPVGQPHHR